MEQLKPIEDGLAKLYKSAPNLSTSARKSLANAMPIIALVFGILQLLAGLSFWSAAHVLNRTIDAIDSLGVYYGANVGQNHLGFMFYFAILALIVSAVTLLMAYPGLKAHKKSGWNWLFLGTLINLVYGILSVFVGSRYGGGFSNLVGALISSAISFYLLYQIRDVYTGAKTNTTPSSATPTNPSNPT